MNKRVISYFWIGILLSQIFYFPILKKNMGVLTRHNFYRCKNQQLNLSPKLQESSLQIFNHHRSKVHKW